MIGFIILLLISIASGMYSLMAMKCKGPILSNTYLWATKDQREKMDIKAEYHFLSIVYGLLSLFLFILSLYLITKLMIINIVAWTLCLALLMFVIKSSVKSWKQGL